MDAARRDPNVESIVPERLTETAGALTVMASLFLGSTAPSDWRRFLTMAASIGATVPVSTAVMPAGLDRLRAAARRYTENSAS